jgi:hypothetical protein
MKLVLAATVAIAALSLAACDAGKKPAGNGAGDTANVGPAMGGTTMPAPTPGAPAGTPPAGGSPIACRSGDLTLAHASDDAGAGQREVVYSLTNNGPAACTLTGFPTLALIDAGGQQIASVTTVQSQDGDFAANGASATVTLTPKGQAVFRIRFTGISGAGKPCVNPAKVRVTPPGNTQAIEITDALQVCDTQVLLSPIRPS